MHPLMTQKVTQARNAVMDLLGLLSLLNTAKDLIGLDTFEPCTTEEYAEFSVIAKQWGVES